MAWVDGAGAVAEVSAEVALEDHRAVARQASRDAVEGRLQRLADALPQGDDGPAALDPPPQPPHRLHAVAEERGSRRRRGASRVAWTIRSRAPVSRCAMSRDAFARVRVDGEAAVGGRLERCHELGAGPTISPGSSSSRSKCEGRLPRKRVRSNW